LYGKKKGKEISYFLKRREGEKARKEGEGITSRRRKEGEEGESMEEEEMARKKEGDTNGGSFGFRAGRWGGFTSPCTKVGAGGRGEKKKLSS